LFYHSSAAVVNGNFAAVRRILQAPHGGDELFQQPRPTPMTQPFLGRELDPPDPLTGQLTYPSGMFVEKSS
jgi:hypothetical protein